MCVYIGTADQVVFHCVLYYICEPTHAFKEGRAILGLRSIQPRLLKYHSLVIYYYSLITCGICLHQGQKVVKIDLLASCNIPRRWLVPLKICAGIHTIYNMNLCIVFSGVVRGKGQCCSRHC